MRVRISLLFAALVTCALLACVRKPSPTVAMPPTSDVPAHLLGAAGSAIDPLVLATGTAGTYTVSGANSFITGLSACAGASSATVTITPSGPSTSDAGAQPAVTIPAGLCWSLGVPWIGATTNWLGAGSVIVFGSTSNYTIVLSQGGS